MRQESIEKTWLYAMSTRPPLLPPPHPPHPQLHVATAHLVDQPRQRQLRLRLRLPSADAACTCAGAFILACILPPTRLLTLPALATPEAPPATRPVQTHRHYHNQNGHHRCAVASFGQLLTARAEPLRNSCSCCRRRRCSCLCRCCFCFGHVKVTRTGEVNKRAWAWGIGLGVCGVGGAALGE